MRLHNDTNKNDRFPASPGRKPTTASDVRIVEERAIVQVEQVVRFFPWLMVCLIIASSAVVFGLVKWMPTILVLNYFIGNAMYLVAKVQITSAQCTGLGIAEGLLLIYFSLGRSWVKALFLFPRHQIKSQVYPVLGGTYFKLAQERIMDFAWSLGIAVPGLDLDTISGLRMARRAAHASDRRRGEGMRNYDPAVSQLREHVVCDDVTEDEPASCSVDPGVDKDRQTQRHRRFSSLGDDLSSWSVRGNTELKSRMRRD